MEKHLQILYGKILYNKKHLIKKIFFIKFETNFVVQFKGIYGLYLVKIIYNIIVKFKK